MDFVSEEPSYVHQALRQSISFLTSGQMCFEVDIDGRENPRCCWRRSVSMPIFPVLSLQDGPAKECRVSEERSLLRGCEVLRSRYSSQNFGGGAARAWHFQGTYLSLKDQSEARHPSSTFSVYLLFNVTSSNLESVNRTSARLYHLNQWCCAPQRTAERKTHSNGLQLPRSVAELREILQQCCPLYACCIITKYTATDIDQAPRVAGIVEISKAQLESIPFIGSDEGALPNAPLKSLNKAFVYQCAAGSLLAKLGL